MKNFLVHVFINIGMYRYMFTCTHTHALYNVAYAFPLCWVDNDSSGEDVGSHPSLRDSQNRRHLCWTWTGKDKEAKSKHFLLKIPQRLNLLLYIYYYLCSWFDSIRNLCVCRQRMRKGSCLISMGQSGMLLSFRGWVSYCDCPSVTPTECT